VITGPCPWPLDLTTEQRDAMRAIYVSTSALHHLSFDECLIDTSIRICLWNCAKAREKARARTAAAAEYFQLT
jgi:hypothetical protein